MSGEVIGKARIGRTEYVVISDKISSEQFLLASESQKVSENHPIVGTLNIKNKNFILVENSCDQSVKNCMEEERLSKILVNHLTRRELEIVRLVAAGHVNKQIADELRISVWTVSTHLRRIFVKLGVDSRAAMTYRCAPLFPSFPQQGAK